MSVWGRREFVLAGAALATAPVIAHAQSSGVAVANDAVQGALVIGEVGESAHVTVDGKAVRVQDGRFCFGFGRDAAKPAEVVVRFGDGREVKRMIAPTKRNFVIQRIDGLPEQYVSPPPEILEPIMRKVHALRDEIQAAGAWVFSGGLHAPSTATVVRVKDGDIVTTDGPYIEGKEHIGGFTVIKAPDLDAALEWGRKTATATTLPIEVRPIMTQH